MSNQILDGNILSTEDGVYDIGAIDTNWKDFYLSGQINQVTLPTSGGTPSSLTYHETGSFTMTLGGIFASNPTGTVQFTRIGNAVHMVIPTITNTTNASGSISVTGIPARLIPASSFDVDVIIVNSGSIQNAKGKIQFSSGTATLYSSLNGASFASGSNAGISPCSLSYLFV
jgi:hypothetical protein